MSQAVAAARHASAQAAGDGARAARRLRVSGVVQGVGYRPFVWTLARRHGVAGSVRNTSGGVVIEAESDSAALDAFVAALREHAPALARVTSVVVEAIPARGETGFRIEESLPVAGEHQPIAADAATCEDCLRELTTPSDRRFRYPFINCTNCGPRFTIIEAIPYDRASTTMRAFSMCGRCRAEYEDPADRRFHAQPNACAACGPRLWAATRGGAERAGDAVAAAAAAIRGGGIVALRGLGGFQLCCDATSDAAVERLRARKHRPTKPFALMTAALDGVRALAEVSDEEAAALTSPARPIVILRRRPGAPVADAVAPGLADVGVMLPATPLHHLLIAAVGVPLVMTSGNLSEEPIAAANDEALTRLGRVADLFLLHDREIAARYDDSVVRVAAGAVRMVRRARGFAPLPLDVDVDAPDVLAVGAHLKNTFCIVREGRAFVGPHVGDLDSPLTLAHHQEMLDAYVRLFDAHPQTVACDVHPDYASTRVAETWWERGARRLLVQHHHAHVASVMAEHRLTGRILGVAFDGAGVGDDGTVWGGELLLCDETSSRRVGHLATVAQPGGDLCARQGWRMALAHLAAAGTDVASLPAWAAAATDARTWRLVGRVAASPSSPRTSSAGRLFDAVASVLGVAHASTYEAEAAMRLEALGSAVDPGAPLVLPVHDSPGGVVLDAPALVAAVLNEHARGRGVAELAAAFHEALAVAVAHSVTRLARSFGVTRVALSGGVFQNALLLGQVRRLLEERDLEVYANHQVPANDGGVSLGQAYVAAFTSRHPRRGA